MKKLAFSMLLLPALLMGCQTSSAVDNTTSTSTTTEKSALNNMTISKDKLQHHNWILKQVDGKELTFLKGDSAPNLEIGEGFSANGQGACNRYFGQAELKGDQFRIDKMASTMMACPEPVMKTDVLMTEVLGNWSTMTLTKNTLELKGAKHTLTFQLRDLVN